MVLSATWLSYYTSPATIYHWIRGQDNFKLYLLKAVFEISDLLMKSVGPDLIYNLSYVLQSHRSTYSSIFFAIVAMIIYTFIHSFVLSMESFIVHVVLTTSAESAFTYVFLNCFGELKISVFKKCDFAGLYQYACNDSVERFQLGIYIVTTLMFTTKSVEAVCQIALFLAAGELLVDYIKHYFLCKLNKIPIEFYIGMRYNLFKRLKILNT